MKTTPYWWEHALCNTPPEVEQPTAVDVAIIGAGYTGLNAALVLARAGVSTVVFEARKLGEGASSRNGGMVGPSFHKMGISGLAAQYGEERSNEILRESVGFVDYLEGFLKTEGMDVDFDRSGRFLGARKPAHYDAMARQLESLQKACGVSGHMVSVQDQGAESGAKGFCGGVVFDKDGSLHPAKYVAALAAKVRAAGVDILEGTPVLKLEKSGGGYRVITAQGQTVASSVAICTNGYTGPQFPNFRRRVLPLRSAMIATEPLAPEVMAKLMPKSRIYGDSRRIIAYYRPSPDGTRILFGSRATGFHDDPKGNAKHLHRSLAAIFPELAATKIDHVWSGLVAYSFDHAPHIGQMDGLYFAMGYCGSGVSRASYFGNKLGFKILGDQEKGRTSFDDLPLPTKPFYTGNPWFMPAVLNWHRLVDRLGF